MFVYKYKVNFYFLKLISKLNILNIDGGVDG